MNCDTYCWTWWGTWYPWAEANQGLISVVALISALVLFLLEQRRANREAADAAKLRADDQVNALAAEERRRTEAIEAQTAQTEAIEQDRLRQHTEKVIAFSDAVLEVITSARHFLEGEESSVRASAGSLVAGLPETARRSVAEARETLKILLGNAPFEPQLILAVHRAARVLSEFSAEQSVARSPADQGDWYRGWIQRIFNAGLVVTAETVSHRTRLSGIA